MHEQLNSLLKLILPRDLVIYPDSVQEKEGYTACLVRSGGKRHFVCLAREPQPALFGDFEGDLYKVGGTLVKVCKLSHVNAQKLRSWFPFTAPVSFGREGMTIGLGDRLGLAGIGHLRLIKKDNQVRPVLAQQSVRELTLTQRTFAEVLDTASWAVFQEGYTGGFGADGDHLKTEEEVRNALESGYSMITLDCSEYIDNQIAYLPSEEVDKLYQELPEELRCRYEGGYLNKVFRLGQNQISFDAVDLKRIVLTYVRAIGFVEHIYNVLIVSRGQIDFEISIDETLTPTTPEAHYFVAMELTRAKVGFTSLAPRFCGEFQKGVDYRGDLAQFTVEFQVHAQIADYFGYRLSIHSGSDKFSVFPIIGKYTQGRVHVKTAGTNWLEAVRVIAQNKPGLYRQIHSYAIAHFEEARMYYHVSTDLSKIPEIQNLDDRELVTLLNQDEGRQLMHITYGLLLTAKDESGAYLFRPEIFNVLAENEEGYALALEKHIGKHLQLLRR